MCVLYEHWIVNVMDLKYEQMIFKTVVGLYWKATKLFLWESRNPFAFVIISPTPHYTAEIKNPINLIYIYIFVYMFITNIYKLKIERESKKQKENKNWILALGLRLVSIRRLCVFFFFGGPLWPKYTVHLPFSYLIFFTHSNF